MRETTKILTTKWPKMTVVRLTMSTRGKRAWPEAATQNKIGKHGRETWPHFFSGHVGNFPHISPRDGIDR